MRVAERLIEKEGTLDGERVAMTIDTSALSHIMAVLTDLYSDPELAVIREYCTNALDSHVEAGQTRPIEVTLPSDLFAFLTIRDFGVGLDADGIREIYSRYGTSTKRDSDDVVGMLGLGCKSALTYCDQFTLVGYKDGTMTTVAVGRDEDGSGTMTIMDVSPTDEPNGLEVVIPAKRQNQLRGKAATFFGWWQPGTVLVNGEEPARPEVTEVVPGRIGLHKETNQGHVVVMGNVAYPLSAEQAEGIVTLPRDVRVVFRVGIGEVNFTPSREALQSTRRTKDTLTALKELLAVEYHKGLAARFDTATTHIEALAVWAEVSALGLPREKALWRGKPTIPQLDRTPLDPQGNQRYANADDYTTSYLSAWLLSGYHRMRKTGERTWRWSVRATQNTTRNGRYVTEVVPTLVFEGFDGKTFTDVKRAKLEKFLGVNPQTRAEQTRLLFVDKLTPAERWALDGYRIVQWADVDAIKLGDGKRGGVKKVTGSYPGCEAGDPNHCVREVSASEIDPEKVLYVHGSRWNIGARIYQDFGIPKDYWMVALTANRVEKFKRDFPKAQTVGDYATAKVKAEWEKLPREARLAACLPGRVRYSSGYPQWVDNLDPSVRDAAIDTLRSLSARKDRAAAVEVATRYTNLTRLNPPENKEVHELIDGINKRFPLLVGSNGSNREHTALYVNAVKAAEGK